MRIHLFALGVKAGDVVGTGKDHTFDPVLAGSLVDVEGADDVRLQDFFESAFGRDPTQVHDSVYTVGQGQYAGLVRQVAMDNFFMLVLGRCHWADVRYAHDVGVCLQCFAKHVSEPAGSTGEQQAVEGFAGGRGHCTGAFY
ncbi:hypothetical protein D9M71_421770 [compost metagenome]